MPATIIASKNLEEAKKKVRKKLGKNYVITSAKRSNRHGLSKQQKIDEEYWKKKHYTLWWRKRKK